jgi:hypothetical protein
MRFRFLWLLGFLLPLGMSASPLPELPSGRIAVSEAGGNYTFVDAAYQTSGSKVSAQYWAAVLKNCNGQEPNEVANAVYEKWNSRLDPGRHILFVACRSEGLIGAHVGTNYSFLGIDGPALSEKLMQDKGITSLLKSLTEESLRLSLLAAEDILAGVVKTRAALRSQAAGTLSQAEGAIDKARKDLSLASEKAGLSPVLPGFETDWIDARLAESRLWLDASPTQSEKISQEIIGRAKKASDFATNSITQSSEILARESSLKEELKRVEADIPYAGGAADDALKTAKAALAELEPLKKKGDYDSAKAALSRVDSLLTVAKEATSEENTISRYRVIYIPLLLLIALLIAAAIAAFGLKRYAEVWAERALGSLDVYGSRIADLAGRLESLRAKYPQLLVGHEMHDKLWNDTLKRYESAGEKYDLVNALLAKTRQLIIKAKETSNLPHPFAISPSRAALRLLQEGNCEIQYGPGLSQPPVMLKTRRTHITRISTLLDEIALSLPAASRELEDLHQLFEEAGPAAKHAKESVEKAQSIYKELSTLGVAPTSAQVELSSLNAATAALGSDLEHDPSVVVKRARVIQESSQLMTSRLSGALELARRACEDLPVQTRALWLKVYELRQNGFKLREAAFEPEVLKERVDQSLSNTLTALGALDLEKAQKELSVADEAMLGLREGIKSSVQSKEYGAKEDAALRARIESFQERLSQEKPIIERALLRLEKAAAKELTEQIERAPFKIGRITQLLSEAERRAQESLYLAAAERRTQAVQQLKSLEDILNNIRDQDKLEAMVSGSFAKLPSDSGSRPVAAPPKPGSSGAVAASRLATPTKLAAVSDPTISKQVPALKSPSMLNIPVAKPLTTSDPTNKALNKPPKPSPSSPELKSTPDAASLPQAEAGKLQVPALMDSAVKIAVASAARNETAPAAPTNNPSTKKLAPLQPPPAKDKKE